MNNHGRTVVITGSASGIGRATDELMRSSGWRTIGIDLRSAQILADLSKAEDRARAVSQVTAECPDSIDAVIACAGISTRNEPAVASVNFFGVTHVLEGLRPLLARSANPRAVAIASFASLLPIDEAIVRACLANDEAAALDAGRAAVRADPTGPVVYSSSKLALSHWIRRTAVTREWAGVGILLNAVSPGTVDTPMMRAILADPEKFAAQRKIVPCPLNRYAKPEEIARTLAFLVAPDNSFIVGQIIYTDGGTEAYVRPDVI
jgi:NAD(P)-dependent dehydrogenase (short-subunit alcohol dehydrogenase family)